MKWFLSSAHEDNHGLRYLKATILQIVDHSSDHDIESCHLLITIPLLNLTLAWNEHWASCVGRSSAMDAINWEMGFLAS